ncbi:hypothetical protein P5673_004448 [Acropora cervicornis]|uniref:Uncharacterized protein n=1 Tax=Acropora cervicornis TaxID=6130 RepID=A0AAD9VEA9_ACRCE|nr:hypothetical protein P5673_004448 [Acropora cervicornis]
MCRSKIIFHKEKNSEKGLINSSSRDAARKGRGYYHLKLSQEKKQQKAGEMYIVKPSISSKIKSLDLTNRLIRGAKIFPPNKERLDTFKVSIACVLLHFGREWNCFASSVPSHEVKATKQVLSETYTGYEFEKVPSHSCKATMDAEKSPGKGTS